MALTDFVIVVVLPTPNPTWANVAVAIKDVANTKSVLFTVFIDQFFGVFYLFAVIERKNMPEFKNVVNFF